jgi:rubrerythrin
MLFGLRISSAFPPKLSISERAMGERVFETEKEALDWYESQPRAITKSFTDSIQWGDVKNHPLNPAFIPILFYMRDVESYTDIYHRELQRTPTGKDPVIKRFMERWVAEEADHGDLLNRFLGEAGIRTEERWQQKAKAAIPLRYTLENYITSSITNVFGRYFSGTHMVWGALNELMTLQGYRRLWQAADHPVLESLLRTIAREESAHARFYWSIARLRLQNSKLSRRLARFVIKRFWSPVGQGTKAKSETDYVIATLFSGQRGVSFFDRNVSRRIKQLPGLRDLKTMTGRIASASLPGIVEGSLLPGRVLFN